MCVQRSKIFSYGHQNKCWWLKSRFCLFAGEEAERFHTTYLLFSRNGNKCPRCKIGQQIKREGKAACANLTKDKIAELQRQIKEHIAFYLNEDKVKPNAKIVLMLTIVGLPKVFNHKELLAHFASLYFKKSDTDGKLVGWEKNRLFSIVRSAGLERTLKANLKFIGIASHPRNITIQVNATTHQVVPT
ncbi:hypothetical protein F5B22DRAFT_639613 [Xylaria bambusicola]|uniref:uncharacterized protein n=1 Tax=Xylaria bambusicola TaxID=326684 RepID=UPI0020080B63|nr:uncharacterized protein F5B22DRAFT_639613 [Xylaria bambusicola]KAI0505881.1 hypothetical protein F5B22DRAFT_639613 [Xylaria bambusicola]